MALRAFPVFLFVLLISEFAFAETDYWSIDIPVSMEGAMVGNLSRDQRTPGTATIRVAYDVLLTEHEAPARFYDTFFGKTRLGAPYERNI